MSYLHDFQSAVQWLYKLRNKGSKLGLKRMERLALLTGNPEKKIPSIHIAGTNGKGSVCAMIESLYRTNGYKVGLFTSPHLLRINERIQINRVPISDDDLASKVSYLDALASKHFTKSTFPSFFEFMTQIAFQYFSEASVDIAIIETGLGGRLDATNIIHPKLSIITSIGKDHTDILGDSIASIAYEKAGIIKKNTPILINELPQEAEAVIQKKAKNENAPLFKIRDLLKDEPSPKTNLEGSYQQLNARVSLGAINLLKKELPIYNYKSLEKIEWMGRWQNLRLGSKRIILDATHNEEACLQLEENLKTLIIKYNQKPIILIGVVGIERAKALLPLVCRYSKSLYLVSPKQPRACQINELQKLIPPTSKIKSFSASVETVFSKSKCLIGNEEDTILVTGSIYLIAEVLTRIKGISKDPVGQDLI